MATNNSINANATTPLPIADGGTAVTSVTVAPAATAFAGWDTNKNLSAVNHIEGFTTTATAASSTTLTVASNFIQVFTGTTTQTVVMPVTSTLVAGQSFQIINNSTGVVTVNSSGSNLIISMQPSTSVIVTCVLITGTTAASWTTSFSTVGGAGIIDAWTQYTPTFTGFGTATSVSIWSRRVGGNLEVRGAFVTGTPSGSTAAMTLGYQGTNANVTISSTVMDAQIQIIGMVAQGTVGAASWYCLGLQGSGSMNFSSQDSGKTALTTQAGSVIFGTSEAVTLMVSVPITGWS